MGHRWLVSPVLCSGIGRSTDAAGRKRRAPNLWKWVFGILSTEAKQTGVVNTGLICCPRSTQTKTLCNINKLTWILRVLMFPLEKATDTVRLMLHGQYLSFFCCCFLFFFHGSNCTKQAFCAMLNNLFWLLLTLSAFGFVCVRTFLCVASVFRSTERHLWHWHHYYNWQTVWM